MSSGHLLLPELLLQLQLQGGHLVLWYFQHVLWSAFGWRLKKLKLVEITAPGAWLAEGLLQPPPAVSRGGLMLCVHSLLQIPAVLRFVYLASPIPMTLFRLPVARRTKGGGKKMVASTSRKHHHSRGLW